MTLPPFLGTLFDLMLVIFGFGMIVFVHELGHFLAARWAGIRVLAFAIGFGPALLTYRKGMGFRRGSTEREYQELQQRAKGTVEDGREDARAALSGTVSPTEYRINGLPFGGYVKMLGQEDLDPGAVSHAPDSYQNCPPWKRMVVISAGVVMNVITAAALFVLVFMVGLKTEPARVGAVSPDSVAATTMAVNAEELGVTRPGVRPGDDVISINGREPNSFNDLVLASAMAEPGRSIRLTVQRNGYEDPLRFEMVPRESKLTGLLELGIGPAQSLEVVTLPDNLAPARRAELENNFAELVTSIGLKGLEPGMRLTHVDGEPASTVEDLFDAVHASGGEGVHVRFEDGSGGSIERVIMPEPELETDVVEVPGGEIAHDHLLGLAGVLMVAEGGTATQGLEGGDLFRRIGTVEYPSSPSGIAEIRANRGRKIEVVVERSLSDGSGAELVELSPRVSSKSPPTIGFSAIDTTWESAIVSLPVEQLSKGEDAYVPAAVRLINIPGTTIVSVDGQPVSDLGDVREALRSSTRQAYETEAEEATVEVELRLPIGDGTTITRHWTLLRPELERLHKLRWRSPAPRSLFALEQFELRAQSPVGALWMGIEETHRVMMSTYTTFLRLFQGSVKVEHLKGPVGIAHIGTQVADRGIIWLLFLGAVVSINLAVINFLPLPIVDGGQFIFLVLEQIRGKPVPVAIQNAAALAGIVLIGAVFVIVTFNDIVGLFG